METELPPLDEVSRFAALHDESLQLLETARSLVVEMRSSLDECRRRRPVVNVPRGEDGSSNRQAVKSRLAKSHRGGRVLKKSARRLRRPR